MAYVTANLLVLQMMDHVARSCRLHWLPTVLRFAPNRSDVLWLFIGINHDEHPSKSRVCVIKPVHSSLERTIADICLKKSVGSYIIQTLNIRS